MAGLLASCFVGSQAMSPAKCRYLRKASDRQRPWAMIKVSATPACHNAVATTPKRVRAVPVRAAAGTRQEFEPARLEPVHRERVFF